MKMKLRFALWGAAVLVAPWAGADESALVERQEPASQGEGKSAQVPERAVSVVTTSRGVPVTDAATAPAPAATARPSAPATSRGGQGSIVRTTITSVVHDSSHIVVTEGSSPTHYRFTKSTQFMDEGGRVLSPDAVKSGSNATLHYTRTDGDLVLTKVIVNGQSRPLLGQLAPALAEVQPER
jgi:hypothetical protein